jgi:hypothetical protein
MIDVTVPTYPHLSAETWIDANNLPRLIDIRSASAFLSSAYITCAVAASSRKGTESSVEIRCTVPGDTPKLAAI